MDEAPTRGTAKRAFLASGWRTAAQGALTTIVILAAMAEAIVFLAYAERSGRPSALATARIGGVLFFAFHHVGFVFQSSALALPQGAEVLPIGAQATLTLVACLMTGMAVAMWLLYRAGRRIADEAGGSAWVRAMNGAKVGVPYAALCLIASLGVRFSFGLPGELSSGSLSIHPSYVAAAVWPLAIGVTLGFAGGFMSGRDMRDLQSEERVRPALAGGFRMLWLGLALAFIGLLVLAVVKPDSTRSYFDVVFARGRLAGLALLLLHSMLIPNMAAWVLFPAMGACVGGGGGGVSLCALSYTQFPSREGLSSLTDPHLGSPPLAYFLFVLAPLIAVVVGGMVAARRAKAASPWEAAQAGALAGVAFGGMATAALVISTITVKVAGSVSVISEPTTLRLGSQVLPGALLALIWGATGGTLGALVHATTLRRKAPGSAWTDVGPSG